MSRGENFKTKEFKQALRERMLGLFGEKHPGWKGGVANDGRYFYTRAPSGHPRAKPDGRIRVCVLKAEKAFGGPLPKQARIHHWKDKKDDDCLVICESHSYHMFLHVRQKAFEACGDVHKRKCPFCQKWDDVKNLDMNNHNQSVSFRHKSCLSKYAREKYKNDKVQT
jgi:hypothetical protein